MVEDRRFRIPVEVESWEEANPILLDEVLDQRLGLDSLEAQDSFARSSGLRSFPPRSSITTPLSPVASLTENTQQRGAAAAPEAAVLAAQGAGGSHGGSTPSGPPGDGSHGFGSTGVASPGVPARGKLSPVDLSNPNSNSNFPTNLSPSPPLAPPVSTCPCADAPVVEAATCPTAVASVSQADTSRLSSLVVLRGPPSSTLTIRGVGSGHADRACLEGLPLEPSRAAPPPVRPANLALGPIWAGPCPIKGNGVLDQKVALPGSPNPSGAGARAIHPSHLSFHPPPNRRSVRLAAKSCGPKKSSLLRAQEIMCKKLKLVRYAAKSARPPPSSSSLASSSAAASTKANSPPPTAEPAAPFLAVLPEARAPPIPATPKPSAPGLEPPPLKDPSIPLSQEEIQQILNVCGVRSAGKAIGGMGSGSALPDPLMPILD